MYEQAQAPADPYQDVYSMPPPGSQEQAPAPPQEREANPRPHSRSRSPPPPSRFRSPDRGGGDRFHRRTPPPKRPTHAPIVREAALPSGKASHPPQAPTPSNVLGVFGLSIRTTERDLEDEFNRHGRVEKVTIVYDQRSDRSRGFGFIKMSTVEEATRCVQELNGLDLNGRRIRVDYSVTERPHAPTPGEYMGHRRSTQYDSYRDRDRDRRPPERERGGYDRDRDRDRDRGGYDRDRGGGYDRDRDRDRRDRDRRDDFGRDNRDWRDRRSPPPRGRSPTPPPRRRRSYSRSPPPRGGSPGRGGRDYESSGRAPTNGDGGRW